MSNSINDQKSPANQSTEARYAADEPQPESAMLERDALTEREDGTVRGRRGDTGVSAGDTVPIIILTADERQPVDAVAEYNALSEREDGTNIG
jgi:hypothetical protein